MPQPADARELAVRAAFTKQAEWCAALGSPFTARLCAAAAERLARTSAVGRRILDWPGEPDSRADALPLRFAGALNGLRRAGLLPRLAPLYPPHGLPDADALWGAIEESLAERETEILAWLESAPQTNEVARSAVLMSGLLQVASETGHPLALLELGASAGLNLVLDHYAYRLGGLETGAAASALRLAPAWDGPDPPSAEVRVVARRGVDLAPLDVSDPRHRERLLAYVWPDQAERIARIEAALGIAATLRPPIDRDDAAAWLDQVLAVRPTWAVTRVVMHSIAFQYFPAATKATIAARMGEAGAAATRETPLAWLQFEVDAARGDTTLRLRMWPGGEERRLAVVDPHARRVSWST